MYIYFRVYFALTLHFNTCLIVTRNRWCSWRYVHKMTTNHALQTSTWSISTKNNTNMRNISIFIFLFFHVMSWFFVFVLSFHMWSARSDFKRLLPLCLEKSNSWTYHSVAFRFFDSFDIIIFLFWNADTNAHDDWSN